MLACTIVARNYLAHARVLARSFKAHHEGGAFTVLVLDASLDDSRWATEPFDVITPYDIGIDTRELHNMATIYGVMELATAVKPWLLKTLLADHDTVTYLDPDIQVFAPLDDIPRLAVEHGIVLTPHTLEPVPRDGLEPSETTLLRAGIFNLGFIAVSGKAIPFLDWWCERLARECVVAPEQGRFVDQRWVDFVPALFDHATLRDPGVNVAWWNLSSRPVRWNGRWEVNDVPIRFFHFSGYDPSTRGLITKHAGDIPRVRLKGQAELTQLYDDYARNLIAEGFNACSREPYGFARTPAGISMDPIVRARYRAALESAEETGRALPPDPFDPSEADAFADWLGNDSPSAARPAGVNVVGYLRTESGVGEAARQLVLGIASAGVPHSTYTYSNSVSRQRHKFDDVDAQGGEYDVNIICVNADQLPIFVEQTGAALMEGRYSIGVWFWEAPVFPRSMHAAFHLVDEVWVASEYIADAVSVETEKPVRVFPLPVVVPETNGVSRATAGLPDGFVFLFSFDFLSVFERKNPLGVIDAFKNAFEPDEGPTLVVKCINGERTPELLERLYEAAEGRDDIRVVNGYVSAVKKNAMMALCDCYVSLHRSEGFGLTMAEAMAHRRPVIATAHGGNMTFMNDENSFLVPYELVPIPPDCEPYKDGEWAEPDVRRAGELMRHVYEHPREAGAVASRGQETIESRHAPRVAGTFVATRLSEIGDAREGSNGRGTPLASRGGGPTDALTRMELAVGRGPGGDFLGKPRHRVGATLARRVIRRALWPFLAHQSEIDRAAASVLDELTTAHRRSDLRLNEIGDRLDSSEGRLGGSEARLDSSEARLARLIAELHATPYTADPGLIHLDGDADGVLGYRNGSADEAPNGIYIGFEDIFRGAEEFIRARQAYYVAMMRDRHPVLDLGSGRGEFLSLLQEHSIPASGVDLLPEMVAHSRKKGLAVEQGDAVEYLASQADGSLGAIFSAQVVEHLDYVQLLRFFELAHRKLRPSGLLVVETVNMHSLAAAKVFWLDPTHVTPLFPEVAVALARLHGFWSAQIVFPNGVGEFERDRYEQGEYALTAEKAP